MTCGYCEIISGNKEAAKLYEDDRLIAFLSDQPATIGHIIIVPKDHSPILESIGDDDVAHMFNVANKIAVAVFESIKSEGTNIMIHNGIEAGQELPHVSVNIIPRTGTDGLLFEWAPKQLSEEEMSTVELQLKEELSKPEVPAEVPKEAPAEEKQAEGEEGKEASEEKQKEPDSLKDKEESYLIKQMRRIP